jgi:CHAT domain-containing protein
VYRPIPALFYQNTDPLRKSPSRAILVQLFLNGLARGFLYAGGRSLLVTHWAVETESAAKITTETLASYAREPAKGKAEALRQAMLKVMNDPKTSHPAFWAAFALVGDGG